MQKVKFYLIKYCNQNIGVPFYQKMKIDELVKIN